MWTSEKLLKTTKKQIDVCGDSFVLRKLKAGEFFEKDTYKSEDLAKILSDSLIDPALSVDEIKKIDGDIYNALIDEVLKLNGLTKASQDQLSGN